MEGGREYTQAASTLWACRNRFGLMTRVFGGLCAALLLATVAAAQSERTFNLGVVRRDGTLIPFAQFDEGTWRPYWSAVERSFNPTVPLTLDDVDESWWRDEPPSLKWTLWRNANAATPLALEVRSPQQVYTPCGTQIALKTNYVPNGALPPPHQAPYPKLGIATTAPVAIEPIREVPRNDVDWQRVKRALEQEEFRNAENRSLAAMHWNHPVNSIGRDLTPIDLQAVWHVKDSRFFYFEAMRRYPDRNPPKGEPPCELVTYVAGYFWEERSEKLRPVGVGALITYCHMERATFLWPFGVIREGGRSFWVFQSAGWTSEMYGIAEPIPSRGIVRRHLWYAAGRCE